MKRGYHIGLRLSERELEVLQRVREARGFTSTSEALRDLIRFADVFFDDRLTVKKALKPHVLKALRKKGVDAIKNFPVCDIFKSVPLLEKELKKVSSSEPD